MQRAACIVLTNIILAALGRMSRASRRLLRLMRCAKTSRSANKYDPSYEDTGNRQRQYLDWIYLVTHFKHIDKTVTSQFTD